MLNPLTRFRVPAHAGEKGE